MQPSQLYIDELFGMGFNPGWYPCHTQMALQALTCNDCGLRYAQVPPIVFKPHQGGNAVEVNPAQFIWLWGNTPDKELDRYLVPFIRIVLPTRSDYGSEASWESRDEEEEIPAPRPTPFLPDRMSRAEDTILLENFGFKVEYDNCHEIKYLHGTCKYCAKCMCAPSTDWIIKIQDLQPLPIQAWEEEYLLNNLSPTGIEALEGHYFVEENEDQC